MSTMKLTRPSAIEFKNINKSFNSNIVLKDISFSLEEGNTVALLGLSGSGKTTALKLICGLHWPDSGEILIQGEKLDSDRLSQVRKKLGYVIQDGGLFPHLTAFENISIVGREAGWSDDELKNRIKDLAEMTRLSQALFSQYPRELSGGQKQRVGIMRAMFLDPPILLLDEPMGALDPITRNDLQKEFKSLFKKLGKTVLLVTHDLFEAAQLADQIILINKGEIAQSGILQQLIKSPADEFVSRFINSQHLFEEKGS